jgi:hypothetical protein
MRNSPTSVSAEDELTHENHSSNVDPIMLLAAGRPLPGKGVGAWCRIATVSTVELVKRRLVSLYLFFSSYFLLLSLGCGSPIATQFISE